MGYELALKAAGAIVHEFKMFGGYQGTWAAIVEYKGKMLIVIGDYGSCSGCDPYEARFGYSDEDDEDLAEFGESYINEDMTWDEFMSTRNERMAYSYGEGREIVRWLDDHRHYFFPDEFGRARVGL